MHRTPRLVFIVGLVVAGCAATLTDAQRSAHRMVEDCRHHSLLDDWSYGVDPNGDVRFRGQPGSFLPVQQCLKERYGIPVLVSPPGEK